MPILCIYLFCFRIPEHKIADAVYGVYGYSQKTKAPEERSEATPRIDWETSAKSH